MKWLKNNSTKELKRFMNIKEKLYAAIGSNVRLERIWKIAQVDFKRRYYNDRIGLIWAFLNPLFRLFIYYFVFKYMFNHSQENYALFIFSGLIIWMFFIETTKKSLTLLRQKQYLIDNIQFDWLDLFYSHILSGVLGLAFNLTAFLLISLIINPSIGLNSLLIPVNLLLLLAITFASCLILSTLYPLIKDINHVYDMITLTLFWISGIFFPIDRFSEVANWLAYVNPFAGIISNFRYSLISDAPFYPELLIVNFLQCAVLVALGVYIFNKFKWMAIEKL